MYKAKLTLRPFNLLEKDCLYILGKFGSEIVLQFYVTMYVIMEIPFVASAATFM